MFQKMLIGCVLLLVSILLAAIPSGDTVTNSIGMKFKRIPAGTFEMGFEGPLGAGALISIYGVVFDKGFYNEHPSHSVSLTQDYYMGVYEVTNEQYKRYRSSHGEGISGYLSGNTYPVTQVTWFDADSFCTWLTANDPNGWTYRLPTEAEWEYACRAGTATFFYTGDSLDSTEANNPSGWGVKYAVRPSGGYAPNPWGFYDMHGNAGEWCLDWYGLYTPSSKTDPAGRTHTGYKVYKGHMGANINARTVARFTYAPSARYHVLGFRVVISSKTKDVLTYIPASDSLSSYQINVSQNHPIPSTSVSGSTYQNDEGLEFQRVRMTRALYPMQKDSVVYVSSAAIRGDSSSSRKLAGYFARRLSQKYGVLYRLSNRYELHNAGKSGIGGYFLTIVPDMQYTDTSAPHPDVAHYKYRRMPIVDTVKGVAGPFYIGCNHEPTLDECPNGDLLSTWYSGQSEHGTTMNNVVNRFRRDGDTWDSKPSLLVDFNSLGSVNDFESTFWDNGKGVLLHYMNVELNSNYYDCRKSYDNGVTWTDFERRFSRPPSKSKFRLGGDTVASLHSTYQANMYVMISPDNGENWIQGGRIPGGVLPTATVLDDGTILTFVRGGSTKNQADAYVVPEYRTTNYGITWEPTRATPFIQQGIGQYDMVLKLHSGRLLYAAICRVAGKPGNVLAESMDNGETWFCRRKIVDGLSWGEKGLTQTRDGVIHLVGDHSSNSGKGDMLHAAFTETWLDEGTCLDVSEWGLNTTGRVGTCPPPETSTTAEDKMADPADNVQLVNQPNPFNPSTVLHFSIPCNNTGRLEIYDAGGQLIRFFNIESGQTRGHVVWDGNNMKGKAVGSGVYLGRLSLSNGQVQNVIMTLMK